MWAWALFTPHPPVVVPQVGGSHRRSAEKTLLGFECLQKRLEPLPVDWILLLSPHFRYAEGLLVDGSRHFEGSLASFGAPSVALSLQGSSEESRRVARHLESTADVFFREGTLSPLDHGSLVPLAMLPSLLLSRPNFVVANPVGLSPEEAYASGKRLRTLPGKGRWGLVASGDLSHCLLEEGPYGFRPEGILFEEASEKALRLASPDPLFSLSLKTVRGAGHCGLNSLLFFLGLTGSLEVSLHSHEWPFGVGYLTASVVPGPYPTLLARRSIESFLETGDLLSPSEAEAEFPFSELWEAPAASFVSIKDKEGHLRGCMGTLEPQEGSLGGEIIANAVTASCRDPRFPPMRRSELPGVHLSVDVLSPSEPVFDRSDLDPQRWGVIVQWQERRGVLLPGLEGVETVDDQIDIARKKAAIPLEAPFAVRRFTVRRFFETS